MPKISAPTVAAHRAQQREALLHAAEDLLSEQGISAITARAVCERAGMARSSFYDYFPSRDDLLVAIAIDAIERWDAEIEAALHGVEPGLPQLRVFVDKTMEMTSDGRHTIASALREAELSPSRMDDLMTLHEALMRPAQRVATDLRPGATPITATLMQGILSAGMDLITHGVDHRAVADETYALLTRGLLG